MDSTEKTGFVTALIIHALLALLLWYAMAGAHQPLPKPVPVNVSLVGDIAPNSSAPRAAPEEPAAQPSQEPAAAADEPPSASPEPAPVPKARPPELIVAARPVPVPKIAPPKAEPKPAPPKIIPKEKAKVEPKLPPKAKPLVAIKQRKPAEAKEPPPRIVVRTTSFDKSFEGRIAAIGGGRAAGTANSNPKAAAGSGSGVGAAAGSAATKSDAEVRRSVNAALAEQIRPFMQSCAPSGVDVDKISTFITVNMASNGGVISVAFDRQTGVNDSNKPQADPLKQCALKAAKQAGPYRGLDPDYHDLWKSHKMQLRAR